MRSITTLKYGFEMHIELQEEEFNLIASLVPTKETDKVIIDTLVAFGSLEKDYILGVSHTFQSEISMIHPNTNLIVEQLDNFLLICKSEVDKLFRLTKFAVSSSISTEQLASYSQRVGEMIPDEVDNFIRQRVSAIGCWIEEKASKGVEITHFDVDNSAMEMLKEGLRTESYANN